MKSFKILISLSIAFVIGISTMTAQIQYEPKINPLALILSGDLVLGCEFILSDRIGVEPVIDFGRSNLGLTGIDGDVKFTGFGVRAIGKYYFSPDKGADKFYIGPYLKYKGGVGKADATATTTEQEYVRTRIAAGLAAGYKIVASSGLMFEIGIGAGRAFTDVIKDKVTDEEISLSSIINVDFIGRLAIGYRFGGSSSSSGSSRKR